MKIINIINLLLVWAMFVSCVEDETVHDFKTLNQVEAIENLDAQYAVMLYDSLKISPLIKSTFNDESRFSYVWYVYTPTTQGKADTLCYTKDLNLLIEPYYFPPGKECTLVLKVTDRETGVFYRKETQLESSTDLSKGVVLLCDEGGQAELNFIQANEEKTLLENVYMGANNELVGRNPTRVFCADPNKYAPFLQQVLIFCDDEQGGVVANSQFFGKIKPIRDAFDVPLSAPVLESGLYFHSRPFPFSQVDYILLNGNVHRRGVNAKAINWEPRLVLLSEPLDYSVAADVLPVFTASPIFYDELNGRLLWHKTYNKGSLAELPKHSDDPEFFDISNLGKEMKLKCWGLLGGRRDLGGWMLLENTMTQQLYIYKFGFSRSASGYEVKTIAKIEVTDAIALHLSSAIGFATNRYFKNLLIYATEDAVYSLVVDQLTESTSSSLEALQKDMAAENMKVTGLKFLDVTVPAPTETNPDATVISQQVRLCVQDLNLAEKQGGVVFYEVNSVGGIHLDFKYKRTGFCDRVIDIEEKYN